LVVIYCQFTSIIFAQYPSFFSYTIENGSPSNDIYCILEDNKGYIWIGCDAGVYRFNGVSFEHFTSSELTARSATGLRQSKSGRIYGYNFNSQVFYIENDRLNVLRNWDKPVNGIAEDKHNNIWISSSEGVFKLNPQTTKWTLIKNKNHIPYQGEKYFADNLRADDQGIIYYRHDSKLFVIENGTSKVYSHDQILSDSPLMIAKSSNMPWLLGLMNGQVFKPNKNGWSLLKSADLTQLLTNRKVNNATETSDGNLWISTQSGLIRYNKKSMNSELLFPQIAFSDCVIDKEGNYWFTTLHDGIIRIPEMDFSSWNVQFESTKNNQFNHIVTDGKAVYFGATNGLISKLDNTNSELINIPHEPKTDFGMLYFDSIDDCIYFNKTNLLYNYKNGIISLINKKARPIKSMLHHQGYYFFLSSQGLFATKNITSELDTKSQLVDDWCRDIAISPFSNQIYIAANKGLHEFSFINGVPIIVKTYLKNKQITSVISDKKNNLIYLLTFDGKIYTLDKTGKIKAFKTIDNTIRALQLSLNNGILFLATNKGIIMIETVSKRIYLLNIYNGLESNNIRKITFTNQFCWIATGKGIQKIPLDRIQKRQTKGKIIARKMQINGKLYPLKGLKTIKYNDQLTIFADGLTYKSNGNFHFAYRLKGISSNWIKVPGSAGKIEFPQLPTGNIVVELKLIDHNGNNSINTITFNFLVNPPFWQRWWFYMLIILSVSFFAYLFFRRREIILTKKQQQELKNLKLENELRMTQQNALKAQMNPHFLFNVLNSIKGYIYENDKKNAARYLSDFSNLVRKVLELSSLPSISLEKEIEVLRLYIDLEAMLLQNDFTYHIEIDQNIDVSGIKIPSLLIQPYIENAFKHGLRHKKGPKFLQLNIAYDEIEKILSITIIDNGVGREIAGEINKNAEIKHESFATNALNRRLELLNHEKNDLVGVEIIDKFDADGIAEGTAVKILIHV